MPFSQTKSCTEAEWTEVFEDVIKPAVTQAGLGYECFRATVRRGAIIDQIVEHIDKADAVVADLTDRNPNVFYELGVRHSLRAGCILITQRIADVPSDLRAYGVLEYARNPRGVADFKKAIRQLLKDIEDDPNKPDGPVMSYLRLKHKHWMSDEDIQMRIDNRVTQGLGRLEELLKETYNQLKDMIEDSSSPAKRSTPDYPFTGSYKGQTGLLRLRQEGDTVHGEYQFDTDTFIGRFEGTLREGVLPFNYRWSRQGREGCGVFLVCDGGGVLEGYYLESEHLDNVEVGDIQNRGTPWDFTRLTES